MSARSIRTLVYTIALSAAAWFLPNTAAAQMTSFSGLMTMHDPAPGSHVDSVMPGATFVKFEADPSSGTCIVHFAGMECIGKLDGDSCSFSSEDCGGPAGWDCSLYYRGVEEGYGESWGIRCISSLYPDLNFHYSGAEMDLTGVGIRRNY
ncbi:MAG: hypothetical protein KDD66_15010 [Bdellovibrionales bacterium]|nr:hypothetical protein [Bdellovibrionales bacterium]